MFVAMLLISLKSFNKGLHFDKCHLWALYLIDLYNKSNGFMKLPIWQVTVLVFNCVCLGSQIRVC